MNSSARLDPLELLKQQEAQRLPWLVPERHRRMAESPFAFFRGAAIVMAADLGGQPHSGLMVQLCGDAHLLNFGFYGFSTLFMQFLSAPVDQGGLALARADELRNYRAQNATEVALPPSFRASLDPTTATAPRAADAVVATALACTVAATIAAAISVARAATSATTLATTLTATQATASLASAITATAQATSAATIVTTFSKSSPARDAVSVHCLQDLDHNWELDYP
jgi:hypothetical protein